jgi:hypothetical protein
LIAGSEARLELWPQICWDLKRKIAHAVRETTLAHGTRKEFFDRADHAGRSAAGPKADHELTFGPDHSVAAGQNVDPKTRGHCHNASQLQAAFQSTSN